MRNLLVVLPVAAGFGNDWEATRETWVKYTVRPRAEENSPARKPATTTKAVRLRWC